MLLVLLSFSCWCMGLDWVSPLQMHLHAVVAAISHGAHATYRMVVAFVFCCVGWLWGLDQFAQIVMKFDNGPEPGYEPEAKEPNKSTDDYCGTRIQIKASYKFKAEKGERKYNNANRLIAEAWVRDYFTSLGMRDIDIVRHMSATVELCLLPSQFAVEASEMANSAAFRARRAAVELPR
jgi:hypothetical protein